MPKLTKSQAERLVTEVERAGDDVERNRRAVAAALAVLLGVAPLDGGSDDPGHWADLVWSAARRDGWDEARTDALLVAVGETGGAVGETGGAGEQRPDGALEALWDLAAELNERRELGASA